MRTTTNIQYDGRTGGTLQLFRHQKTLDSAAEDAEVLPRLGVPRRPLDRAGCIEVEPGLYRVAEKISGGLHLSADETGDCYKFTKALAGVAESRGVSFRYKTRVLSLELAGGRISHALTDNGKMEADTFVVALGCYAYSVLRPMGVRVRVYPVKGYSVTMPVLDDAAAPQSTIMDERYKVAITRLGDRIRAAGTAEPNGFNLGLPRARCDTILHSFEGLFPDGGDTTDLKLWAALRPMNPDGKPTIGPTRYPNLYVNTGHGSFGWAMACGSAKVVAGLVRKKQPEIDLNGLTLERYH